jgi:hypothetical protein
VSYVIAAYGIVIGTLIWYAWRVQSQRRQLKRRPGSAAADERDA